MRLLRVLAVLLFVAGANGARPEDKPSPDALQAATELMAIISPDMTKQMVTQVTAALWPVIEEQARAQNIDAATLTDIRNEFERIQIAFMNDAIKMAPAIYARHFTAAELHDLIMFYRTPTGIKALRELPQVTGEIGALLMPLNDLQAQTNTAIGAILRQHGYVK